MMAAARNKISPPTMSSDKPKHKKKKRKEPSKRASANEHHRLDPGTRVKSITGDRLINSSDRARSSTTRNSAWSTSEARSASASSAENVLTTSSSSSSVADCLTGQELSPTRSRQRESLRWRSECDDSDEEAKRIRAYKQNRRKRYIASLHERAGIDAADSQKTFYA